MKAERFFETLLNNGLGPFTGVPCSIAGDLITCAQNSESSRYYTATSEGEAMGIAAGFGLTGKTPVVIMQNDGFGNAVNPLSSLQLIYEMPALLIITWRAEPGGKPDAPQHLIMGRILLEMLDIMGIPYSVLEDGDAVLNDEVKKAKAYMTKENKPCAFIIRRGYFETEDRKKESRMISKGPRRADFIRVLAERIGDDIAVATTGYTGREMLQEKRIVSGFYMAGSMGCAGSIGLALALERPEKKVYILDGDGALLMKMGTLGTIGFYAPPNMIHILFDNGSYESTGGQETVGRNVNFTEAALNAGYRGAESVETINGFSDFLDRSRDIKGPLMCRIKIEPGTLEGLKRPEQTCRQLKEDFMRNIRIDKESYDRCK